MAAAAPSTGNEPVIEADPEVKSSLASIDIFKLELSGLPTLCQTTRIPPNVKFEVDDCEEPWTFQEKFDVVHARYLAAAVKDWPRLTAQAFQFTKPGGYAEFQDYDLEYYSEDGTLGEELSISKWITTLLQASRDFQRDPCPGPKLEGWMRDAGFADVQATRYKIPIGPWPKDKHLKTVGAWNLVQIEEGLEAFTLRLFTQTLGWRTEEVQVLLAEVRKNLRDPKVHAQFDLGILEEQAEGNLKDSDMLIGVTQLRGLWTEARGGGDLTPASLSLLVLKTDTSSDLIK
ncbi:MAG: hypothetical protein Q9173_005091 [Seirophora scorigena]